MNVQNQGLAIGRVVWTGVLVLSVCWVAIRPAGALGSWTRARGTAGNTAFSGRMAAWASRLMKERGRRLSVEDEMIRMDWDKSFRKK